MFGLHTHILFFFLQEIEWIRAHHNIEDFVYYDHHRRHEHQALHHFVVNPIFSHLRKHILKVNRTYELSMKRNGGPFRMHPVLKAWLSKAVSLKRELK